jgi:2-aminoadipate transaminase
MYSQRAQQLNSSFIRDILAVSQQPGVISFAGGLPDPSLFPLEPLKTAINRSLEKHGTRILQYGESQGIFDLRNWIATHLMDNACDPERVMITSGSQQGLDLVARTLLDSGDTVIVETPSYLGALQVFRANGARIVSVPMDAEGAVPAELEKLLKNRTARCFYTVTNFHNPTGLTYSAGRRREIARLLQRYGTWLIEDDPYRALRYHGSDLESMHALLPQQSFYLGSFSKTIAPSLRLGWVAAAPDAINQLLKFKQVTDLHSSVLAQEGVMAFLSSGALAAHLGRIRSIYGGRMEILDSALRKHLPRECQWTIPDGGMFIWVRLPGDHDSHALFKQAIDRGVAFVPGRAFYDDDSRRNELRLNFTNCSEEMIREGVQRLSGLFNG